MKNSLLIFSLIAFVFASRAIADPGDRHFIFKASALFPIQIEKYDSKTNKTIITKISLGTREIVNLALARPFYQPLNPKTEVLAVDVNDFDHNQTTLVVYRPDSGLIYPICELAAGGAPSTKVSENPSTIKEKGTGLGPGTIIATDPSFGAPAIAKNSFQSTEVCASSNASFGPGPNAPIFTLSATGIIGDFKAKMTDKKDVTTDLDGLIIKGAFTASGQAIKTYFE